MVSTKKAVLAVYIGVRMNATDLLTAFTSGCSCISNVPRDREESNREETCVKSLLEAVENCLSDAITISSRITAKIMQMF